MQKIKTVNSFRGYKQKLIVLLQTSWQALLLLVSLFLKMSCAYTNRIIHMSILKKNKQEHVICIALYSVFYFNLHCILEIMVKVLLTHFPNKEAEALRDT